MSFNCRFYIFHLKKIHKKVCYFSCFCNELLKNKHHAPIEDSDNDCDTSSPPNTTQTSPAKPETEKTAKKSADSNKPVPAAAKPDDSGAKTDQSADKNKPVVDEKKERIPPRRRPSLLKTVVSIKG